MTRDWDDSIIDELSRRGDAVAQQIVREFLASVGPVGEGPEAIREAMLCFRQSFRAREGRAALAAELFDEPPEAPPWLDESLLEAGQRFFADNGLEMCMALFFASLPLSYAVPESARVLARSSDLGTGNLTRRVAETGQLLIDVMGLRGTDTFHPGGMAHGSAVGLRVMHGFVRELASAHGSQDNRVAANQALLLSTLLDFTLVTWEALERLGIEVPLPARRAHLHAWSVVGHLLGVEPDLLPLEPADAERLIPLLWHRYLPAPDGDPASPTGADGRRLMAALLEEMRRFMPLGWGRAPQTIVHWLFRDLPNAPVSTAHVPRLLGVPSPSRPILAVLALQRWSNRRLRRAPLVGPLVRWASGRAGRLLIVALADGLAPGAAPFQLPPELLERWRLRSRRGRPAAGRRLRVRSAVRARIARPSGAAA